ncbi:hypothetical protein CK203_114169 [Vitis vinifera]|uniref:Retrotransposon gag domain-containing protein n=1 Tax=Vitis vinifera TaxID=29760 RepID=A0A438CAI1_VITVI|nr:hypothetical protein CK203_114169 [Vitis vinifera]
MCMPKWIRDSGGRLVKCDTPQRRELEVILNIMEATPEDQHSHQEQLVIRPYLVPLLPTFHGMESENPYAHIKEFEDDKAKIWLNSLRPRSIRSWTDLQAEFLKKFFPTHRTNGLKRQISNFSAKENEKFYECWERYMEAINACPHHGFDTWLLVSYFYDGMSSSMKQLLETMCGGDFMSKNPEEAMDFLSYVADVSRGWDEPTKGEVGKMKSQLNAYNAKAGMPNNNAPYGNTYNSSWRNHPNFSWKARATQYQQPDPPSQQSSSIEQAIANLSKVMGDFIEKQEATNARVDQRIDRVESMLNKRMDGMQNDMNQKFDNIQYSISRLTNLNTLQEKGRFPSQPHQNPKGVHEVESQEGESSQVKDVKALITLRSGKKLSSQHPSHMLRKKKR